MNLAWSVLELANLDRYCANYKLSMADLALIEAHASMLSMVSIIFYFK